MPEISVVIPTHGGRFLTAAVESVTAQTIESWELVIVDDGSRDGTAAVAARLAAADSRIRVVTQPQNGGIVSARNRGLGSISAGSRFVAFLDHDDVWMPDALAQLREALERRPAAAAAHGKAVMIDGAGTPVPPRPGDAAWRRPGIVGARLEPWPDTRPTEFANLAYEDCIVSMGSGLIRRATLDAIGGFDPRAEPADDYDVWIRLSRRGEIAFVDRVVLGYRLHDGRASLRPPAPRGRGTPYVKYKMITAPENTPEQRRTAIAGFRARQRRLFREHLSDLGASWRRRRYRELPGHLTRLGARVAAFARGRPWSWHR